MMTVAPSRARLAAIANPIPAVEPVTRAVLFSSSRFMFISALKVGKALLGCSHAFIMQNYALLQFSQMERPELRGCLKSPDSRQILSSMCSLKLPESWNEAYSTFCELGIGRTFQTPSDAFAGASNRLIYGARRTFEFRTKRRCIDSPLLLSPSPTFTIFAPPQILTKPMQNTRPFSP